ncbi:phenylalanine--tRNA ligase subunit beta [Ornithobacterium rhinotracheale]|uniref:phenylalanine--tRNA ligase subunit beta n=1 Tax=Ornithobacterium rhinotracheale TaxID=28251 RepID=UPI00129D1C08|nr:phenylalanine--tRNA ligase subunit beta [Ornithobacterium rhinotracheale]MRJ09101.1 phenylalanine--tRNA ligase subunit beta [Ornithobacterium rhinotracheale]UOH78946.1 phenylalanine--tRNA ligase subunit beta [Ornithobacterium rhinotracheale]
MKISHQWLSDFLKTDLNVEKVSAILTDTGLEVEGVEKTGVAKEDLEGFVVGKVLTCEQHPNADKLKVTTVDLGNGNIQQIVCGAPNIGAGQNVPVATVGTVIKDDKGNSFTIKKAKLRGEESNGMICSQKELRISEDNSGIWVMDESLTAGTPLSEIIDESVDYVYEIGLTANRADAMSHFGVARDAYVAMKSKKLNATFEQPDTELEISSKEKSPIEVKVEDAELCPRYAGIYIKGVKVAPSPQWLQQRLKAIGLSPKNNLVDATNYVLHGLGQPMHAFDADKIAGNTIIVKKATNGEKFTTLDEVERTLSGDDLMICNANEPMCIAGVMGGKDSAVSETTQNIFLESAYFNPVSVRKTAKSQTINSDSSFRFERGIDPNYCVKALHFAVKLIQEIAGGEVVGEVVDVYPTPIEDFDVLLQYRNVERILGERLHREKIKEILELLDIEIISETDGTLELKVPAYRVDVQREIDVIEDILRIYGYNNIQINEKVSSSIVAGEGFLNHKVSEGISDLLITHGFNEAMNLSMYKKEYNDWLGYNEENSVTLINSLSQDVSTMRRSLLPSLLSNLDYNIKRRNTNIKLFEFGKSYRVENGKYIETPHLALAVTGDVAGENWQEKSRNVSFFYLKGVVEQILEKFKAQNTKGAELEKNYFTYALNYLLNEESLVYVAEVNKDLLKKFDIEQPVYYAEFTMASLYKNYEENKGMKFKNLPKFPSVRRDLALLLNTDTSYDAVRECVEACDSTHIKGVNLFDVYQGDKLPEGKKSYAISLQLQDEEKTMNDKQIDAIMKKVIKALQDKLNAELRN